MLGLKVLGLLVEKDGKIEFIKVGESIPVDLPANDSGESGITDTISPEEEQRIDNSDFEEGLDKRIKR